MYSSRYHEVICVSMPEVDFADKAAFNDGFAQVVEPNDNESLSVFVMRQMAVCTPSEGVNLDATLRKTLGQIDPDVVTIGERRDCIRFRPEVDQEPRHYFHIDMNNAKPPDTQVNIYVPTRGAIAVSIVPLLPKWRSKVAGGGKYVDTSEDTIQFCKEGKVNSGVFEQVCYTTVLRVGDEMVFADALNGHDFSTVEAPRQSYANIYDARRAQPNSAL